MVKRIIPGAMGAGIYQINLLVDMIIATLLPTGSIAFLFYADRITQLPLGVVGVAVGTALLPLLSRQLRSGDEKGAEESLNRAIEFSLMLTLPAAGAYIVMADILTTSLFQRAAFTAQDAQQTAAALFVYAFGLPAYVLNKALTPGFFARGDTKTPMIIAVVCMLVNITLNLILMGPFAHIGLAMATSISAWTNTVLLALYLAKRKQFNLSKKTIIKISKIIACTIIMMSILFVAQLYLALLSFNIEFQRIVQLVCLIILGLTTYFGAIFLFRVENPHALKKILIRK